MACEQQSRACQLLPVSVTTEQQSLVLVKKLLAIAVSCITYLRGLFPEKAYGRKYVEEQKVMILREEKSCPGASQIVQWMHGCFDALQKKYLRMVVLSLYTDGQNPQKVTECYQFKIQYTEMGPQLDFISQNKRKVVKVGCSDTRKASVLLVRKLYTLMQNLGPLPDSVFISMELSYYDEVTPYEYQPIGFKEAHSESVLFEKEPVQLTMGEVVTPFHTLKVDVTTEKQRLEQVDEEAVCKEDEYALIVEEEQHAFIDKVPPMSESHSPLTVGSNNQAEVEISGEIHISCQENITFSDERLDNSEQYQMDCLGKKSSDAESVIRRTRSGHIMNPAAKEKDVHHRTGERTSQQEHDSRSQFTFPYSQEEAVIPKRRKFSEPKESY